MAVYKVCDVCKDKDKKAHSSVSLKKTAYRSYDTDEDTDKLNLGGQDYCIDCLVNRITSNYGGEMAPKAAPKCYRCNNEDTSNVPNL